MLTMTEWFDELEMQGRAALEEDLALEPWLAHLATLEPAALVAAPCEWRRCHGEGRALAAAVAEALGRTGQARLTVFWSAGSPFVAPGAFVGPGLPDGPFFTALLSDETGVGAEGMVP
jgi:hypothetical protein